VRTLLLLAGLLTGSLAAAQNRMAQLEKPPDIGFVFPAGGRPGTTNTVQLGGEHVYGATAAIVSGPGVVARIRDARDPNAGRDIQKKKNKKNMTVLDEVVTVEVILAPDAAPGNRDICLVTSNGVSNKLTFQVGQLPEMREIEPNNKPAVATPLPALPVLVNGRIMPGDVDTFKFTARRGQHLVIAVAGRVLRPYIADGVPGWFQAILTLSDAEGRTLACADADKFRQDPVLCCDAPADGEYFVSLRDTIYRGREDFVYRLRIGELPLITNIFPLGARRGEQPVTAKLSGCNLPADTLAVDVNRPGLHYLTVTNGGLISDPVPFAVDDLPEVTAAPAAAQRDGAQKVDWPVVINGCLRAPGEQHAFRFAGRKDQTVCLEVRARRLGSPLDSWIVLRNSRGEQLAENDDVKDQGEGYLTHQADSELRCRLPEDGDYTVTLRDTQGHGGPDYAYRLRISPPQPDFELRAMPAALSIPAGGAAPLAVQAIRRDGFTNAIQLALAAPADGLTLDGGVIQEGADKVSVTISSARQAVAGAAGARLCGTAVIGGKTVTHPAVPAEELMQAFLYQHLLPFHEQTVLVTQPEAPFSLAVQLPAAGFISLPRGREVEFQVHATRRPGYDGPIRLALVNQPKGITVRRGFILAGRSAGWVTVRTESKVKAPLRDNLIFTGTMLLEREATPEERARMEAFAAKKAKLAATNAVATAHAATTNAAIAARPASLPAAAKPPAVKSATAAAAKKPLMIRRPVQVNLPAVPFRVTAATPAP